MTDLTEIILSKIKEIAFKKTNVDNDLFETGILSSILVVDLALEFENEFNISIPFTEITLDNFRTVEKINFYLNSKIA